MQAGEQMGLSSELPKVSAVVFDFDGLLMDTESTSLLSWEFEWHQWGLTLNRSTFFVDHGGDVTEQRYARLAAEVGPRFDRDTSHRRRTAYRDRLHDDLDIAAGLREWFTEAGDIGLHMAVASSSPRRWLEQHLGRAGVLEQFEVIAAGDEVEWHKPAPDVYQLALKRLGMSADSAVAVEDTEHGVAAAQAAGLRCIAIPNPFVDTSRVNSADLVLTSAAELSLVAALRKLARAAS